MNERYKYILFNELLRAEKLFLNETRLEVRRIYSVQYNALYDLLDEYGLRTAYTVWRAELAK